MKLIVHHLLVRKSVFGLNCTLDDMRQPDGASQSATDRPVGRLQAGPRNVHRKTRTMVLHNFPNSTESAMRQPVDETVDA